MNQLDVIKNQINDINTKRVRLMTLVEQAQAQCDAIQEKYNVKSLEELKVLMDNAQFEYNQQLQAAQEYITNTNAVLSQFNGVI